MGVLQPHAPIEVTDTSSPPGHVAHLGSARDPDPKKGRSRMADPKRFVTDDKNGRLSEPCLDLTLFGNSDPEIIAPGLSACLEVLDAEIGDKLGYYAKNNMKRHAAADKDTLSSIAREVSRTDFERKPTLAFTSHSGQTPKDTRVPAIEFEIYAIKTMPSRHFLRFCTPWSADASAVRSFRNTAMELAQKFDYLHGYAGVGTFWNSLDTSRTRDFLKTYRGWLLRHKGLIHGVPSNLSPTARSGLVDVNWLTFIRDEAIASMGGESELTERLPEDAELVRFGDGRAMLQAGPRPLLGDVSGGERVDHYDEVARLLEPLFAPARARSGTWVEGLSEGEMTRWMNRHFE